MSNDPYREEEEAEFRRLLAEAAGALARARCRLAFERVMNDLLGLVISSTPPDR
jgi:hypothetical protein